MRCLLLTLAGLVLVGCGSADLAPGEHPSAVPFTAAEFPGLQDYAKSDQLTPPADGKASLYMTPWRSNVRTASAHEALQGFGVYYKHIPGDWGVEGNTAIMKQLKAAGVQRLRIAPHLNLLMVQTPEAQVDPKAVTGLVAELKSCHDAGIRPCVIFVHIPPMSGGDELAAQWAKNSYMKTIMPWGKPGDEKAKAYFDKVYAGFKIVLDAAREAGFTKPGSYDLELGQNIWWGFPAMPPFPGLTMSDLQPGGITFEFEQALLAKASKEGYREANYLWGQGHHQFGDLLKQQPDTVNGWAISFYHPGVGLTDDKFVGSDDWPKRDPLKFAQGKPPVINLVKPEGWMADFSRRDNLIGFIKTAPKPVAITSLGVVPDSIPGAMIEKTGEKDQKIKVKAPGIDGWDIKTRSIVRTTGFWLNQGSKFVLIHSAYEGKNDEMSHALIPYVEKPADFRFQQSKPLSALRRLADTFANAKPMKQTTPLSFRYALAKDSELIPASEKGKPLMASDAMTILPFQLDRNKFAVLVYVQTPDITKRLKPTEMTLSVDKAIKGDVKMVVPANIGMDNQAKLSQVKESFSLITLPVTDDVAVLVFETK